MLEPAFTRIIEKVAAQYEAHPYPEARWYEWLRPSPARAHPLVYELGQYLRTGRYVAHDRHTRILVAGSGTVEPLVVARAHPRAQIVAVDLSQQALKQLKLRTIASGLSRRIHIEQADLHDDLRDRLGQFDYILCTGMLHHTPQPELVLDGLARMLKPGGILRTMTYAPRSRMFVYLLQDFFRLHGITATTPRLRQRCRELLATLAHRHPFRSTYEAYSDAQNASGVVDGFFHAFDRAIPLHALHGLSARAGLKLVGFGHAWHSQPAALIRALGRPGAGTELLSRYCELDAWSRLEVIDDCLELTVNPVLWLAREPLPVRTATTRDVVENPALAEAPGPVPAPLMPAGDDELVATFYPQPYRGRADQERALLGGCLLGNDGSLPPGLAVNRCETPPMPRPAALSAPAPLTSEDRALLGGDAGSTPSPVRAQMLGGLRQALTTLGVWEGGPRAAGEALNVFARLLEPRITREGDELPWLSSGDLLRDLGSRCHNDWPRVARIVAGFPAPDAVLEKQKDPSTQALLLAEGSQSWFVRR